jgi:hypothetical protein
VVDWEEGDESGQLSEVVVVIGSGGKQIVDPTEEQVPASA